MLLRSSLVKERILVMVGVFVDFLCVCNHGSRLFGVSDGWVDPQFPSFRSEFGVAYCLRLLRQARLPKLETELAYVIVLN